jgi:hypothetical protein
VLCLRIEFGPPEQGGVAKHPQIPASRLRPELIEQSAPEGLGAAIGLERLRRMGSGVGHVQLDPITISPPFSEKTTMSTQQDENQPVVMALLVGVVVLVVGLAIGMGVAQSKKAAPAAPAAVAAPAAPAAADAAAAPAPADAAAAPAASAAPATPAAAPAAAAPAAK